MRAYAARAANDAQRAKGSEPTAARPSSTAYRPPSPVMRPPRAAVRGLAPSRLYGSQRTDDALEREAEATADALSQSTGSVPGPLSASAGNPPLVRPSGDGPLRGGGEALDHGVRRTMEPRLGVDLGGVRLHRGAAGTAATTALNARAVTVGRDIAFAAGEFRPGTTSGQRLLAHELTHVAQQARLGTPLIQRQPKASTDPWQAQIHDILPGKVGLLTEIYRITQLVERFTTDELNELIGAIHADPIATAFTKTEAGVPGIFALHETRIGQRLDVPAARFLLKKFPAHPAKPRTSEEKKSDVFSEDVVRNAYIRFHYNAILRGKDEAPASDLPNKIRQDCISIVHELAPKLFTSASIVKTIEKRFKQLQENPETFTMVHTGDALADIGVADTRDEFKFKDAQGRKTNGNTEPTTLDGSPWDKVVAKVGNDFGWHIFGMAIMDGHHSVTLFVDNQPEGMELYWADQWRIEEGDDFFELPGAISGFRQYEKAGFEKFIATKTNEWWNKVHQPDSKCGTKKGKNWDHGCRYNATLMLWHLRKVVERRR